MMLQDAYRNSAWRVLSSCVLMNRCRGDSARPVAREMFDRWPGFSEMADADPSELATVVVGLGLAERRADALIGLARCCRDLGGEPVRFDGVAGVRGIGSYARESFEVFVARNRRWRCYDKEVVAYVGRAVPVESTVDVLGRRILGDGVERSGFVEMRGFSYAFDDGVFHRAALVPSWLGGRLGEIRQTADRIAGSDRPAIFAIEGGIIDGADRDVNVRMRLRSGRLEASVRMASQDVGSVEPFMDAVSRICCEVCGRLGVDRGYVVGVFVDSMVYRVVRWT